MKNDNSASQTIEFRFLILNCEKWIESRKSTHGLTKEAINLNLLIRNSRIFHQRIFEYIFERKLKNTLKIFIYNKDFRILDNLEN